MSDDSLAYLNLEEVKDEAAEDIFELLEMMQEELQQALSNHANDLAGGNVGELASLREEIAELSKKTEELEIENNTLRNDGGGHREQLEELEDRTRRQQEELTMKGTEISNLKATITEFENKTNELQRKLHDQEQTARNKIREATKKGRGEREKSRELSQALEENRILRTEIEELEQDRDTLIAALEEQHEEMTKAKQEAEQAKTAYEDVQKQEDILKDQLVDTRKELLDVQAERHEYEKIQASHETIIQRLQEEHELENREIKKSLRSEKKRVAELQEENERMRDSTQVGALQKKLTKAENALKTQKDKNKNLQEQIEVGADELRRVAEKYIDLDDNFNEQLQSRVKAESRKIQQLEGQIKQEKERTELVRQNHSNLMEQLHEEQQERHEAEMRNTLYEQGHGLEQAVAVQKHLKKDIKTLERTLIEKGRENEKLSELNDVLEETCRRFKNELALPPDFKYDDLEIRQGIQTEIQRLHGLNVMWQQQNKDLESERLRLLKALRTQAQMHSNKGGNALGLNADQLLKLNEFVDQLKQGKEMEDIVVLDDKSQKLKDELDEIKVQLRVAQKELDSVRADHDEANEHLQQAYDKGFVAEAVKFRPRPTRETRRREERPEDTGSEDSQGEVEDSYVPDKKRKHKLKKRKKKKRKDDAVDFTDEDDDESIMDGGGMSEENMRMILDELKQTRKDNEKLQDLLKTQIKDDFASEMNQISKKLTDVLKSQSNNVITKEVVVTQPVVKPKLSSQPSARTLEARKLANEQMKANEEMKKKLAEMMKLQEKNAQAASQTSASRSESARQHEEHSRELQSMIASAAQRNKEVTDRLHKEQIHAEEAEAEANALRQKLIN